MMRRATASGLMAGGLSALAACAATDGKPHGDPSRAPVYLGAAPVGLGSDLYGFAVQMKNPRSADDIDAYVTCIVAGYALQKKRDLRESCART